MGLKSLKTFSFLTTYSLFFHFYALLLVLNPIALNSSNWYLYYKTKRFHDDDQFENFDLCAHLAADFRFILVKSHNN